jgi:hypothetical protein
MAEVEIVEFNVCDSKWKVCYQPIPKGETPAITVGNQNILVPQYGLTVRNNTNNTLIVEVDITGPYRDYTYTIGQLGPGQSYKLPLEPEGWSDDMPNQPVTLTVSAGYWKGLNYIETDRRTITIQLGQVLTVAVNDPTMGTTDTNYPPGTYIVQKDSQVSVTAIPYSGYDLDYWTLDGQKLSFTTKTITITVDKDYTLTAYFKALPPPPTHKLTVAVNDPTMGTTDSKYPPGTYDIPEGTTVQVTAIPNSGYKFDHWTLNGTSITDNPITFTMTQDYTLTAYFSPIPTHTLTVSVNDPTMGTTDGKYPPGTYTIQEGTSVTVTANPNSSYKFSYWMLDGTKSSANPITFTIDKDYTLTAYFQAPPPTHKLTVAVNDATMGTTDSKYPPGTYDIPEGTTVSVTAIPNSGYKFDHWTLNGTTSTENPITFIMDKDYTLTAYFVQIPPPTTATLTGTVKGLLGMPVKGADVRLNNLYRTTTNSNGVFTITNIPLGTYTLTVTHWMYEPKVLTIELSEARTYTIDVVLQFKRILTLGLSGALMGIVTAVIIAKAKPPTKPKK